MHVRRILWDRSSRYIALVFLLLELLAIQSQAQTFSPPLQLTDEGLVPQMAVDANGNINVAWRNLDNSSSFNYYPLFTRSTDHGVTFSVPKAISGLKALGQASPLQIAVDSTGAIHFLEVASPSVGGLGIFYSRSTDGGATFS